MLDIARLLAGLAHVVGVRLALASSCPNGAVRMRVRKFGRDVSNQVAAGDRLFGVAVDSRFFDGRSFTPALAILANEATIRARLRVAVLCKALKAQELRLVMTCE